MSKNNSGTILSINKKKLEYEELPHELFLGTIQATKIRSAFAYSKQLNFKCNKSIWKEISEKRAVRAEKGFTLLISNEDVNDITKIIKLRFWCDNW